MVSNRGSADDVGKALGAFGSLDRAYAAKGRQQAEALTAASKLGMFSEQVEALTAASKLGMFSKQVVALTAASKLGMFSKQAEALTAASKLGMFSKQLQDIAGSVTLNLGPQLQEIASMRLDLGPQLQDVLRQLPTLDFTDIVQVRQSIAVPTAQVRALSQLVVDDLSEAGADTSALSDFDHDLDTTGLLSECISHLPSEQQRTKLIQTLNAILLIAAYVEAEGGMSLPAHLLILLPALLAVAVVLSERIGD